MDASRIYSLDVVRLVAITAVIAIHTSPFGGGEGGVSSRMLNIAIDQGARFAVPFFFVISGYFFARKAQTGDSAMPSAYAILKRLALIWFFWSLIYLLPYELDLIFKYGSPMAIKLVNWKLTTISNHPVEFIFQGTKVHLWFLVSLGFAVFITALFLRYWGPRPSLLPLMILAILLYGFGLCAKAYSATPIGIHVDFNTRNGPFFSLLFFVTGCALYQRSILPKHLMHGVAILIMGYALHFGEIYYLYSVYHVSPTSHDYVVGTYFVGLGAALIALSNHPLLDIRRLSEVGKYTLGIYAIHYIFVDVLGEIGQSISSPWWEVGYILIVLVLSVAVTLAMSRIRFLKNVVA